MARPPRIGRRPRTAWQGIAFVAAWLAVGAGVGAGPAAAPDYPHKTVKRQQFGTGATSYWLFEPADPAPEAAPVVVLNHGWLAINPGAYGRWIEHMVRSGKVVIFPKYQADAFTRPSDFLPNAIAAVADALDVLDAAPGHVRPDRNRFALIGHSAGGNLAAQMAVVAIESKLPKARAVIALMPGEVTPSREPDLAKIPADTLLVVAAGSDDRVVGDSRAREIFTLASAVPLNRKKYVLYRSDLRGAPRLVAHHATATSAHPDLDSGDGLMRGFQMSIAELNAFDVAGIWPMTDATLDAAFAGRTLDEATDRGATFRNLGYWSDGRPVQQPVVGDDLSKIPRVIPSNGVRLLKWSPDLGFPGLAPSNANPPQIADKPAENVKR
jgi:acetyl esterase/lipase